MHRPILLFAPMAMLALGGCGEKKADKAELDRIDAQLGGKVKTDPLLAQALEDQIMVDPNLTQQANEHSTRAPDTPFAAQVPLDAPLLPAGGPGQTLGARAAVQAGVAKDRFIGCALDVSYSQTYANLLPAGLPLHPKAQVIEAAGSNRSGCQLRAVTFAVPLPPHALADFYLGVAKRGGYAAQTANGSDGLTVSATHTSGAAFYLIVKPDGTGSSADLVSNRGR